MKQLRPTRLDPKRWPGAVGALLLTLVIAACGQVAGPDAGPVDDPDVVPLFITDGSAPADTVVERPERGDAILAEFAMDNGSVLRFIDERGTTGEGGIGLLEVTPRGAEQILPRLDREGTPTALEVFRAVAPSTSPAPARLVENHLRIADVRSDVTSQPRDLALPALSTQATSKGVVNNSAWCDDTATQTDLGHFHSAFKTWVHNNFSYRYHGHGVGYQVGTKYGVTGTSKRRALYVCSFYDGPFTANLKTSVWRNGGLFGGWDYVAGTSFTVPKGARMYYRSEDSPFDFARKYRVKVVPQHHWATYNIEGSWGQK